MKTHKPTSHPPSKTHPWLLRDDKRKPSKEQMIAKIIYMRRELSLIDYLINHKYMSGIA